MSDATSPPFDELQSSIRGELYLAGDSNFGDASTIFNGNVKTTALAVACPLDAQDISKVVLFCTANSLSLSVKAGGYGTAGWAIAGQVIVDMSHLADMDIETPLVDGGFTSLRDMVPANSKGKGKQVTTSNPGKRRREDTVLRNYELASPVVAGFLRGEVDTSDEHVRSRRRLNDGKAKATDKNQEQNDTTVIGTLTISRDRHSSGDSDRTRQSAAPVGADPFGYIDKPSSDSRHTTGSSATPVANPRLPANNLSVPSQPAPVHQIAYVTFGAGKRQKEVDIFTASHPLDATSAAGHIERVPYHVPFAAHPAGSAVMIQGGFGFLSRLHGLSIDILVEAEMVLADGSIVIVNEQSYPDLWWALRGAGPAFGIVTRYKAKAFPVPVVFAGNLIYRFRKATAGSLIKHYRDCVKGAPRELYANVILTAGPAGKDSLVVIQMCYIGPKERGQEFLSALSAWNGETCLLNEVDEKSFLNQQDSVAQVLRGKAGRQWYIRSALITSLPDDVIYSTVNQFADTPVGCTWLFELAGGAIVDTPGGENCFPKKQREAAFNVAALHQWDMGVDDPKCVESAEGWIAGTLLPVQTGGPLPSFLGRHEPAARTISCYGENWKRLCEIKKEYDPSNVFRNCLWPVNEEGSEVEPQTHEPPSP